MFSGGRDARGARATGRRGWWGAIAIAWLAVAVPALGGGCNAISGVGDLDFSAGGTGQGGSGAVPAVGGGGAAPSSGSAGAGTGGTGGASCGACLAPPNDCHERVGSCVDGACEYAPLPAGSACDDGNACTPISTCQASGQCAGPECPSDGSCHLDGTCVDDACQYPPAADGTSCGLPAAEVCCSGACVNISTNPAHCGGCGFACHQDEACQSVEVSSGCELSPADTSGRCTCPGENAKCPAGLVCRTDTPYNNLCSPNPGGCPQGATFVEVNFCPNYCQY